MHHQTDWWFSRPTKPAQLWWQSSKTVVHHRWECSRKAGALLMFPLRKNQPLRKNCLTGSKPHHAKVGNWLFWATSLKFKKTTKFGKLLVFIGCWRKTTFWSSPVPGIRERTGQPIPNAEENLSESKSAKKLFCCFHFLNFWTNFNVFRLWKNSFKVEFPSAKMLALNNPHFMKVFISKKNRANLII